MSGWQSLVEGFEDPTVLVASEADKEVARAAKTFGAKWIKDVCSSFSRCMVHKMSI